MEMRGRGCRMAERPIFRPMATGPHLVESVPTAFTWHAGLSVQQKQRSIRSLHESARKSLGVDAVLEISSKSESEIGVELSAFNLTVEGQGVAASVEVMFQGSKVFSRGGPFSDLYGMSPREAKRDQRLKESGYIVGFRFGGEDWPTKPETVFYDWLYISALLQNDDLASHVFEYDAFSDIEFNPKKSINCQARSAALYVSLVRRGCLEEAVSSPGEFIKVCSREKPRPRGSQVDLF